MTSLRSLWCTVTCMVHRQGSVVSAALPWGREGTTPAYVVNLTAGVATITLTVVGADGSTAAADSAADLSGDRWGVESRSSGALITERNVDAILLHPNQTDIDFRMNTTLFPNCNPPHTSLAQMISHQKWRAQVTLTGSCSTRSSRRRWLLSPTPSSPEACLTPPMRSAAGG